MPGIQGGQTESEDHLLLARQQLLLLHALFGAESHYLPKGEIRLSETAAEGSLL